MTKSKKTTIKKGSSKTEEIRSCLQKAETQLDSLTQKLVRPNVLKRHTQKELFNQAKIGLMQVRKLQFKYFKVETHSLLRYSDGSEILPDGKIKRNITKSNWRKYKKEKMRKQLKNLDVYWFDEK